MVAEHSARLNIRPAFSGGVFMAAALREVNATMDGSSIA
jgi:hypothetical protein